MKSTVVSVEVKCGNCGKTTKVPFNSYNFSGGSQQMDYESHSWCMMTFKCPHCRKHEEKIELYGD